MEREAATGRYQLGLALIAQTPARLLAGRSRPILEEVRDAFQETVNFAILDGSSILYVEIVESLRTMRLAVRRGDREGIHCTGLGKAIAAQLSDVRVREILGRTGMAPRTAATITDVDAYIGGLVVVRERGWALDDGENEVGARCVAAGVTGLPMPAAISLSAPSIRFPFDQVEAGGLALQVAAVALSSHLR